MARAAIVRALIGRVITRGSWAEVPHSAAAAASGFWLRFPRYAAGMRLEHTEPQSGWIALAMMALYEDQPQHGIVAFSCLPLDATIFPFR